MGYQPGRRTYVLQFEDRDGLEVKTSSCSTAELLDISNLMDQIKGQSDMNALAELAPRFEKVLQSWNVEDDNGEPVPATAAGLLGLEHHFGIEIVDAWVTVLLGVPDPLEQPSDDGSLSLVESLPMEPLSPSRAS